MTPTLLTQLLQGEPGAIEAFGAGSNCVIVDWKARLEEILEEVAAFLPDGYLHVEDRSESSFTVRAGGRAPLQIEALPSTKQEDLLVAVSNLLSPDYELRQFTPVDGDGYALFLATLATWRSIERSHPKETARYFLSVERLARYWKKGFLARLASKP